MRGVALPRAKNSRLPDAAFGRISRRRRELRQARAGRWSQEYSMSDSSFDCVSCGACCFSRNPRYLSLLPWDAGRSLPADSLFSEQGQTFVKFECGHCVHLDLSNGKAACGVYEDRPEACRAFRAGSFECVKARRANGIMGERVRPVAA
ncbi:MAG TPA: hypothetical protein DDY28_07655 [Hyphomonas atlantica]|nr:hypothetical protein [Hyphomonas atlantica]